MHSFSCFFLLHHHFEALTPSPDSVLLSKGLINDDTMSDESGMEDEQTKIEIPIQIPETEIIQPEHDDLPSNSTINPVDEESQFIYDDNANRLICVGTTFDDIPQTITDSFALKTKVKTKKYILK